MAEPTKKTNELKKGVRVQLQNGWFATIVDNAKGNIRTCDVEGIFRDTGSVYSHDIVSYLNPETGSWGKIEHTPAQLKLKATVRAMGM